MHGAEFVFQGLNHLTTGEDSGIDDMIDAEIRIALPKVETDPSEIRTMSE